MTAGSPMGLLLTLTYATSSGSTTPLERIYAVRADDRILAVEPDDRTYAVPADDRVFAVESE